MAAAGPVPDEIAGLAGPPPGAPPSIQIGGGPPPGGPEGGLPPELMAALGGGGGPEEAAEGEGGERGELDILDSLREDMMEYMTVADDDIEKEKMAQALKIVQGLLAKNQSEHEAAGGVSPAIKGMRKGLGG